MTKISKEEYGSEGTEVKKDIEFSEELQESIMRAFDVEATSKTIEALTGMTLEQIAEEAKNGGIVPKQKLPVIPKFVAEWIEEAKDRKLTLYGAIHECPREADYWLVDGDSSNQETFARAWLDGYTVEEEQKYYVEDNRHTLLCKWESSDGWKVISTIESTEDDLPIEVLDFELTEQEIKDYDERFWPFAVKVKETEENGKD